MQSKIAFFRIIILVLLHFSEVLSDEWTHHTVLDGNGKYHLYWTPPKIPESSHKIKFKVVVEAHGYLGFGLSPNGAMAGSDIFIGWIRHGELHHQDTHAIGNELPIKDAHQDWEVLSAFENGTHTSFTFERKLDTCDEDDMVIDDSTMRVIFAYSHTDPHGDKPQYHHGNRGVKSILLLQPKLERKVKEKDPSLRHWDIRSPNFTFPGDDTMYWCKIYKSPDLHQKHHIIHVKPLIQPGNEEFVHHMLLYECVGGQFDDYEPLLDFHGHECHRENMPEAMKKCEGVTITWAVGGEDLVFPEHVGLPLEPAPGKYFMLEMHYDNQMKKKGIVDQSGFRIYYTPNLRKHDAGSLMIGSSISVRMFIPPGRPNYVIAGHSNPECLGPAMPEKGIKALGVLLHSHVLGRKIIARHFRRNKELVPLAVEKSYDFNYQEYRYFKKEIDIHKEDQITVECTYNSTERSLTTLGGESTREEMCLAFVLYYPRIDRFASISVPTLKSINEILHRNFTEVDSSMYNDLLHYDWKGVNLDRVQNFLQLSDHSTHCYLGDGNKNSVKRTVSYPNITEIYEVKRTCPKGDYPSGHSSGWLVNYSWKILTSLNLFYALYTRHLNSGF